MKIFKQKNIKVITIEVHIKAYEKNGFSKQKKKNSYFCRKHYT